MGVRQVVGLGKGLLVGTNAGALLLDESHKETWWATNRLYVGGHALCRDPGTQDWWFNSTPTDSLVRMSQRGKIKEIINLTQIPALTRPLDIRPREIMEDRNYRAITEEASSDGKRRKELDQMHINSIQFHEGAIYATACTHRAFVRVRPAPKVILQDRDLRSPHDFTIVGNRIVVNDSGNRAIIVYDMNGHRQGVVQLHETGSGPTSMSGWTRGLAVLDPVHVLVGTTPLGIIQINLENLRVEAEARLSDDVRDSCHGLTLAGD
jgi:hypothetical protein